MASECGPSAVWMYESVMSLRMDKLETVAEEEPLDVFPFNHL